LAKVTFAAASVSATASVGGGGCVVYLVWRCMMAKAYRSAIGIPGGSEVEKCFYPFKVDTYGCGCPHNCLYCYSRSTLEWRKLWNPDDPAVASVADIESTFLAALDGSRRGRIADLVRARMPVRLGSKTDCFSKTERVHRVSFRLLQLLREHRYPYLILTKGDLLADPEYLDVLDPSLAYVQFSVTTPYDDVAATWEPGAPVTSLRLRAIETLRSRGIHVAARICPLIPIYPDGHYSQTPSLCDPLNVFDWHLVDQLADAGCETIIAGFLRLNYYNNNRRRIVAALGFDPDYLFSEEIRRRNDALYFSIEEKRYYYETLRDLTHQHKMAFSVCYDGDEAYEVFRYLWDNPNDCCNAPFSPPRDLFGL